MAKRYVAGQGYILLTYNKREKEKFISTEEITPNRVLIYSIIEALKMIKEPCMVKVYTRTAIGVKSFHKPQWRHFDLACILVEIVREKGLAWSFIDDSEHPKLLYVKDQLLRAKRANVF